MGSKLYGIQFKIKQSVGSAIKYVLFEVRPTLIFVLLILLTTFWASYLPSLKFNYNIESFFSSDDPEVDFYYKHRKTFGNENDYAIIGIGNDKGIFQRDFLIKIDALSSELNQLPKVKKIISPTNLYDIVKGPLGSIKIPLVHTENPDKYIYDKKRIYSSGIYVNTFFSPDANSVSLMVKKGEGLSRVENDKLLYAINTAISAYEFDEFHVAGRIKTQHYYITQMRDQMVLFGILAIALFFGSLFLIFNCIKYVLLSFTAVLISQIWIFGIIGWMGISLDLMLTILPTLIFIIGTSGSIHLITWFRREYMIGVAKHLAIRASIIKTGMPNFLNAFTTAIGFASLSMIPVSTIQRFGLFTALGILITFFIGLLFIPTALKVLEIKPSRNLFLEKGENKLSIIDLLVFRKSKLIIGAFTLFVIIGLYFSLSIKINNHFLDDLNSSSSLKKDLDFFEQNFSGIRPFEMNISSRSNNSILDYKALSEMEIVEQYLKDEYNLGSAFSPMTYIKGINRSIHGGDMDFYRLPGSQDKLNEILKLADKQYIWNRFYNVISNDKEIGRITGKTHDDGSLTFARRNEKLKAFLRENTDYLQFRVTGAAQLMDNANRHIAKHLLNGILLAIVVTTLVIGLFTRSWKLGLLSLIPNLFPLILVGGFMGAMDIPLKITTALIFTIVYGIAVDDTIHFLNSFRHKCAIYLDSNEAIRQTVAEMWRPMLFTSIVLCSGFMIFLLSEFSSIAAFGVLIGSSLIIALVTDIILLPALLSKIYQYRKPANEKHLHEYNIKPAIISILQNVSESKSKVPAKKIGVAGGNMIMDKQ